MQVMGGLIIVMGYLPQIFQLLRTRSAEDLNMKSYLLVTMGVACVEVYAINMVVVIKAGRLFLLSNTISLVLLLITSILIAFFKWRARPRGRSGSDNVFSMRKSIRFKKPVGRVRRRAA